MSQVKNSAFTSSAFTYIPYCEKYQSNADKNGQNKGENFEGHDGVFDTCHAGLATKLTRPGHKDGIFS